ncbi:Leucine-rich repeat-containing protein 7 [Acipenser ruthenus]|uniref:Leucine-rich repeat-containing protein 7 n=1 Tax=Acipenser ruthenus TaxID=7906 RepID=A0A444U0V9_ACIRT|nr:Leucine-rich repeat-containing protein 7 [Acipenser ruthenus]
MILKSCLFPFSSPVQCLEMTTKRKLIGRLVPCRCFRGEEEVISVLDYSHCSLQQVPKEIFSFERTLEELYLDANQIEELPKQLFNCQALRKLSMPDNDLSSLPATIASLVNLKELDISKNGIQDFPDNIKCCKCLTIIEASVNPIAKLPDGFTQLLNLMQLYLNDAFLEYLPANFGRLTKLRILELRENHLKTLPKSIHRLTQLERLDLGNNEFTDMPEVLEQIQNLKELWMDNNGLQTLPGSIGKLKQLTYLDMSKNRVETIDSEISGCEALEDLLLSSNMLQQLPDSIGMLKKLTTLKVDDNQLTALPNTIGSLSLLEEFDCSCNELESLPPTIGYLHNLRTLAADENFLSELPREIGSCKNVTVMSLRSNKLEFLPEEIGQMQKLRVLNLSDNRLLYIESSPSSNSQRLSPLQLPVSASYCSMDSLGGSPNDIRISDMRPTLVEPPLYKPKVVLMGKEKKESTDESDTDKMHCLNNSGSSATYSDYSPSQGSSGSSNPPGNVGGLQTGSKDGVVPTHWTNRLAQSFPQPIETKPLLSQRESAPAGIPQQRNERHPLTDTFDNWNDGSHYDNTGFVAEETGMENSGSAPMLGSNSRSASTHGRRPLMRQDRIVGVPLELEQTPHTFHNVRNTPETEVPAPNPWQNWTRTPSPFEDRTAFPSKLESTPASSPAPDRKDFEQEMGELPGTFPSTGAWGFLESRESGASRSHYNIFHCRQDPVKGAIVISKSTERLSPMMKEVKAKFKKSQSIDEIDIGSYKVYSIPLDNYGSSTENQGSLDKPETQPSQEQSMSRSQSVPMLDEDLEGYASGKGSQQQKPPIPKKVYHFDQSFNPKGAVDVKSERRLPTSFNTNPEYMSQQGKNIPKEVLSPRGYRGYTPMEHMFSFSQPSVNEDSISQQFPSQRSRPGFLRRADSLVSSTEMALFRRVTEAQELPLNDRYNRTHYKGMLEHQNSLSSMAESQFHKRNGRYEDEYSSYQETKKPITGFPVKNLTQRRPLSARSYSTESYGASQARPVSARPTMAALLEKVPSDYNLSTCTEKTSDNEMKMRTAQMKGDESSSKMPVDWRQQLLRHIEAKRLDRGIFVTRVQPDGSACNVLQPGDKILKANGHSFSHLEHEKAVSLLKSFPKTVDLFLESDSVGVSQHLTNTVFVDRALIVVPFAEGVIPDEAKALSLLAPANAVAGLLPGGGLLPTPNPMASVIKIVVALLGSWALGGPTLDQGLAAYGLQGAGLNSQSLAADQLLKLMSSVDPKLNHVTAGLVNPAMKSDASSKEIEEAMKRVREAQSLISAAIEPGNKKDDKRKHSRSRSRSRRRRSRSRSRHRDRKKEEKEKKRSKTPPKSYSTTRRSRSPSRDRRRRRSRSVTRSPPKKSPKRKMSKSPSPRRHKKEKKKDKERERDRGREREKDRDRSRDERERSTSKKKKSKDKEKERERKSDGEKGDVKVTRDYDEEEQGYDSEKDKKEDKGSDSASPKAKESSVDKGMGDTVRESKVNGDDHHEEDMDMSD